LGRRTLELVGQKQSTANTPTELRQKNTCRSNSTTTQRASSGEPKTTQNEGEPKTDRPNNTHARSELSRPVCTTPTNDLRRSPGPAVKVAWCRRALGECQKHIHAHTVRKQDSGLTPHIKKATTTIPHHVSERQQTNERQQPNKGTNERTNKRTNERTNDEQRNAERSSDIVVKINLRL